MSRKNVGKHTVLFEDEKHLAGFNAKTLFMVDILSCVIFPVSLSFISMRLLSLRFLVAIEPPTKARDCVTTWKYSTADSVTQGVRRFS